MGLGLLAQTLYGHTIRCHVVEINGGQAELGEKWGIPALSSGGFPDFLCKAMSNHDPASRIT